MRMRTLSSEDRKEGTRKEQRPAHQSGISREPLCLEPLELSGGREGRLFGGKGLPETIQRADTGILRESQKAFKLEE